ncbi:MAG: IS66 family insertion sequence element accessory protein TnpB [Candidatus Riflebacteria bacterium]|nr:IS66 family insertion sequence element accessory protein TnpB [Candidatus Riflebacteria bacterium]
MIQITPHIRIFQHIEPIDFRNGIDGIASLCRSRLKQDPMNGALFIFINRKRTAFKLLIYDSQGFWLCQKRFSQGKIKFWPKTGEALTAPQLQVLLYNGNPLNSRIPPPWKQIST